MVLTDAETELLAISVEDGFPLVVLASSGRDAAALQETAIALLRKGLIGVYEGGNSDFRSVVEAEAILASQNNWTGSAEIAGHWFISTTREGDTVLASLG